ncbi:TetR/AcrR family transcriptional regulator [Actinomadura kijaniata]|uniref:TetR/AcrR family transcriptional regulator n=1 Tax=Actinomadura kijaniata TaxID=46161 RepID=UPI003F1AFE69
MEGRRERKVNRTRRALAEAALELVRERGFAAVTVQEIADRVDVSRRTFSRHFTGKEDALVEPLRVDFARINEALADRPAGEPPLVAYRGAVLAWLAEPGAWHRRRGAPELFRLAREEPAVLAVYRQVSVEAEDETARVFAARTGADEVRAAVLAAAAAGAFRTGARAWWNAPETVDLPGAVERAFEALLGACAPGGERS